MKAAAIATGTAMVSHPQQAAGADPEFSFERPPRIIDTNVSLFRFPFRRLPLDSTSLLVGRLRDLEIDQAWAGSFEGVFHRNLAAVNQRLATECKQYSELIPIGMINLSLPDWEADFQQCCDEHHMPGVRLYPNYHQFQLDSPEFDQLLAMAHRAGCFVQIVAALEDTRTQHQTVQVPDVDFRPLLELKRRHRRPCVQLLNMRLNLPLMQKIAELENVFFDSSRIDGTYGLSRLMNVVPAHRVCFGSHSPFLIPEAALIRAIESPLSHEQRNQLLFENSQTLNAK